MTRCGMDMTVYEYIIDKLIRFESGWLLPSSQKCVISWPGVAVG